MNEQELFKILMMHQENLLFLLDENVFDTKRGNATLNFDEYGMITSVRFEKWRYKKKKGMSKFDNNK